MTLQTNTWQLASLLLLLSAPAWAVNSAGMAPAVEKNNTLPALLEQVGIDQHVGEQIPLDLTFSDDGGKTVRFGELLPGDRPAILVLAYYQCPMLCTTVLNELVRNLKPIPLTIGKDFDVIVVSFNPRETSELAAAKKASYLKSYQRPGSQDGWHFLTGQQEQIDQLTRSVGFRYVWDETTQQYLHPSGVMVLTPQGKLSRYFYGIHYIPHDLRLALTEAAGSRFSTTTEQILLYCYHFDAKSGRYTLAVLRLLQGAAVVFLLGLGTFFLFMFRRERPHV